MSFFDFLLIVLASLGVHRIWNYERITERVRSFLQKRLPFKTGYLITCAACNALWITSGVAAVSALCPSKATTIVLFAFSAYPFLRLAVWAYGYAAFLRTRPQQGVFTQPQQQAGCLDCEEKKIAAQQEQKRVLSFKKRVVLLTSLNDFHASYSVSSCVLAQARMLAQDRTCLVQVWVKQTAEDATWPADMPANVELRKVIPAVRFLADEHDPKIVDLLYATTLRELMALGNATIIVHDLLFQASYLSFAAAIHRIGDTKGFMWWHQAHSGPNPVGLPGDMTIYRYTLPAGDHRILCLSSSQRSQFAKHYNTSEDRISVVPNARDPRVLWKASKEISAFISAHALYDADVVQVYPFSTPRAWAKGVHKVMHVFGDIKKQGKTVRLVLVNAHANNNTATITELREAAKASGLTDSEVLFTSEHFPRNLSAGLPEHDVQVLFQFTNVFVFPTVAEACSLVQMEASLAGNLLVINSDVPSLSDVTPPSHCLAFPFGLTESKAFGDPSFYKHVAESIVGCLRSSHMNQVKRQVLKTRSLDAVGVQLRALVAG